MVVEALESLIDDGTGRLHTIVATGELPSVFADDVRGRVNPAGVYDDLVGTIEYFYGLAGQAAVPGSSVVDVQFPYLVAEGPSDTNGNGGGLVMARFDVTFSPLDVTLALFGAFRLNSNCEIQSYDITAVNLGKAFDPPEVGRAPFIEDLCGGITNICTGPNAVYSDFNDCRNFMNSIDFGTYDRAASNSVICRSVHLSLAGFRPDIHCPHVSRGGGGKCIDTEYSAYFEYAF